MPLPIIADVYRAAIHWNGPGGLSAVNVMHFLQSGTTPSSMATTIDAHVTATMWQSTTTGVVADTLTVTPLDGSTASFVKGLSGSKWAGTSGTTDVIPQATAIVSLRTAFRGRSKRGRVYLPFVAEASVTVGVLAGADVTTGQAAWTAFLAAMIAAGAQPVVASYKLASQVPVTSYVYEAKIGTQRRRMSRLR